MLTIKWQPFNFRRPLVMLSPGLGKHAPLERRALNGGNWNTIFLLPPGPSFVVVVVVTFFFFSTAHVYVYIYVNRQRVISTPSKVTPGRAAQRRPRAKEKYNKKRNASSVFRTKVMSYHSRPHTHTHRHALAPRGSNCAHNFVTL